VTSARSAGNRWRSICLVATLVSVVLLGFLAPHLSSSEGLVKLRNSLLIQPHALDHDWSPVAVPADFMLDQGAVPRSYTELIERHRLREAGGDWPTALAIARHLLSGGRRSSGPIKADLKLTYERIVGAGAGYCGDYSDVFIALANAAGVFSRSWAFSFDGFGGHGHIFNEVWDSQARQWRMLDVHNNVRPEDMEGRPLSAVELRERLLAAQPVRWLPIEPATRPGYRDEAKLVDYYRRGLPQWYLWWGTNVFEYDDARAVRVLAPLGRSLEQLGGIAADVHPGFRVLATPDNVDARAALSRLRWLLLVLPMTVVVAFVAGLLWWRAARCKAAAELAQHRG
jgi:hypothetical protein